MAVLRVNRAKKLIANGLREQFEFMALYQHDYPIEVGQNLTISEPAGKSDGSPFFVKLNPIPDLDSFKVVNDFSQISYDGSGGGGFNFAGLDRIMNFFIDHRYQVSKIVITTGVGARVTAVVHIPTITPTNGEDENFLINLFEILID